MINLPPTVKLLTFEDPGKIKRLWENLKPYAQRYGDSTFQNPEIFTKRLMAKDAIIGEIDGGLILLEHIIPNLKAEIHLAFWDHKLSPHRDTLMDCLIWAFFTYNLERLETFIESHAKAVRRFIEKKMGFKHEGTMYNRVRRNNELINVEIFAILKNEVL